MTGRDRPLDLLAAPAQTEDAGLGARILPIPATRGAVSRRTFPISAVNRRAAVGWTWRVTVFSTAMAASIGFSLAGCRSAPALTPEQAEGKQVYDVGCAHCHEENDLHLKKVPPNLRGLFSRATLPSGAPASDAGIEHVVMTGKGTMPSFAYQLTREQMAALLAYLHAGMRGEQKP